MGGTCTTHGTTFQLKNTRKYEGKQSLGRPKSKYADCSITNLAEMWYKCVGWIHLAQEPAAGPCKHCDEFSDSINR